MEALKVQAENQAALLSVAEAAKYLSISRSTLLRMTYRGLIPSVNLLSRRLYSNNELDAWIQTKSEYKVTDPDA